VLVPLPLLPFCATYVSPARRILHSRLLN
jgi:hypothetical protein